MRDNEIRTFSKDVQLVKEQRERIAKNAVKIFVNKGYAKTLTREIAEALNIGVGTLYYYIGSKKDILLILSELGEKSVKSILKNAPKDYSKFRASGKLSWFIEQYIRYVDANQDMIIFWYREIKSLHKAAKDKLLRGEIVFINEIEKILRKGIKQKEFNIKDTHIVANNISVTCDMWAFRRWKLKKRHSLENFIKVQQDLIFEIDQQINIKPLGGRMNSKEIKIEPFLMAVLVKKFEAITNEMTNTLLRSGRSGVLNMARDFSCAITDNKPQLMTVAEGLPVHVATSYFVAKAVNDIHGANAKPGDAYLNNCPYYGNTHHADFTICVPVFYDNELLFYSLTRAHQADCGCHIPTTYPFFSKDIYEEGLHFPCVKVQSDYKNIDDWIRLCKTKIRVPDQWYGDYLAQIGSVRIGEKRLVELCDKYGVETIKKFSEEVQAYGERRMIEEIRKYPKGTWENDGCLDPVPGICPDGIPFNVKMSIDPDEAYIDIKVDSIDNVPGGLNLSEATATAGVLIGVFNCMDHTLPHNEGAFSRVRIKLREGAAAGKPKFPAGTGVATTNLCDRLINCIGHLFSKIGKKSGMAEGATGMPPSLAVVSGYDKRKKSDYVNQLILGHYGGPALYGHDGWVPYCIPVAAGILKYSSIEIEELKQPIFFDEYELIPDTGGAGEWDGAPSCKCVMGQRFDSGMWVFVNDSFHHTARGAQKGHDGAPSDQWKYNVKDQAKIGLDPLSSVTINVDERIVSVGAAGGGYGAPLDRDPEKVRLKCREGYISDEKARNVYGVVLDLDTEEYSENREETEKLRKKLKEGRI